MKYPSPKWGWFFCLEKFITFMINSNICWDITSKAQFEKNEQSK